MAPWYGEPPSLVIPTVAKKKIPLSIHGDAVVTAGKGKVWSKMLLVLSWVSCLASGSAEDVCNLMYSVPRLIELFEKCLLFGMAKS